MTFINVVDDIMWKTLFTTLYFTGLRIGELTALTDDDISFVTGKLTVNKSLTRKTSEAAYKIGQTKNTQSNRIIALPGVLIKQLEKYYAWKKSNTIESTFLFGGNQPISEQTRGRRLETYCKNAGVKKIRTHDFRHSHASYLISLGTDILLISNRLGHGSVKETLDTYGHLYPSSEPQLMERLNNATQNINF